MPKISVLMSAYNAEKTIATSLYSILCKTERDLELVCIDDGSTDSTLDIIESIARNDKRLKYVVQPNQGLTSALIYAASIANGCYFARQDADDISFPRRLECQELFLKSRMLDMVSTRAYIESSSRIGPRLSSYFPIKYQLLYCNPVVHGSMFMRSQSYWRVGGYNRDYKYSQDYDLACRMALADQRIAIIRQCLYFLGSPLSRISVMKAKEQAEAFESIRNGYRINNSSKMFRRILGSEI